jgi:hypothetical protein
MSKIVLHIASQQLEYKHYVLRFTHDKEFVVLLDMVFWRDPRSNQVKPVN